MQQQQQEKKKKTSQVADSKKKREGQPKAKAKPEELPEEAKDAEPKGHPVKG